MSALPNDNVVQFTRKERPMINTGNPIVDAVGQMSIQGNVVPVSWFRIFKFENGKPDINAIIILSEIAYWYRPTITYSPDGSQVTAKKKFKADLLQRSYESFAEQFGLSKRQVKEALDRLESSGVLARHFRTIFAGTPLNNVLFIELIPSVLSHVLSLDPTTLERKRVLLQDVPPPTLNRGTNTKITTEITTNNKSLSLCENWSPKMDFLKTVIQESKGIKADEVLAISDFDFHLNNFNAHWEDKKDLTENQRTRKFAIWIIEHFNKSKPKTSYQPKPKSALQQTADQWAEERFAEQQKASSIIDVNQDQVLIGGEREYF